MTGKRPYVGSIYTLPLTAGALAVTQLEQWTWHVRQRMAGRGKRTPTGLTGSRSPGRGCRTGICRRPRRPTCT